MAQFEVPQNIDLESKIVGPLTLKQFGFVAVPALISFFFFFVFSFGIWIFLTVILVGGGVSFAFIKVNGRPLYVIALLAARFFWKPKLFLWKRPVVEEVLSIPEPQRASVEQKRSALKSALGSLSSVGKLWQDLTTRKTPIPKREKIIPVRPIHEIKEQYQVFRRITGEKEVARRVDYR